MDTWDKCKGFWKRSIWHARTPFRHRLYSLTTSGGSFLIYNIAIYALRSWLSRTVCASKNTSPSLFINKTSTAIDNFMAMNPCGSGQKKPSRGLERRATRRVLKDWRGRSMFQPMAGMHLNMECSPGWRSRKVARRSCRRQSFSRKPVL